MELIFNPCGQFRRSPEGPVSQIHSPHLHVGAPGIFSGLLRSDHMIKREWGAESNGKLSRLFIPSKTAIWVPEFAVKDLPMVRTTVSKKKIRKELNSYSYHANWLISIMKSKFFLNYTLGHKIGLTVLATLS